MRKADFSRHRKTTIWRHKRRLDLLKMFGGKCQICGYSTCPSALSFHHRDPSTKLFAIGAQVSYHRMDRLIEEAKKCDLLCRNCHVEHHHQSKTSGGMYSKYYKLDIKKKLIALYGGKCVKCGYFQCIDSLVFHHRNPKEKEFILSSMRKWDKMVNEANKCDLLCQNCHVETHYQLLNTPTPEFIEEYLKSPNTNSGFQNVCSICGAICYLGKTKRNFICTKCKFKSIFNSFNCSIEVLISEISQVGYLSTARKYNISAYILKNIVKAFQTDQNHWYTIPLSHSSSPK